MYHFSQHAIKLLNEYKNLLRKHVDSDEISTRLTQLELEQLPEHESDLYRLIVTVIELEAEAHRNCASNLRYSGLRTFREHLQDFIAIYRLEGDRVIHPGQTASRAAIQAIQLMGLEERRLDAAVVGQLDTCGQLIAKYGEEAQKMAFFSALKLQTQRCPRVFIPLLTKFRHYLGMDVFESMEFVENDDEDENEKIAC